MVQANPKTKSKEVWDLVTHTGLKDLKRFSPHSKNRLALKKSLQNLENSLNTQEYIDANTALGLLENYENNYLLNLHYFKKVYNRFPENADYSANYARSLISAGFLDSAIEIFDQTFLLASQHKENIYVIIQAYTEFLYVEKANIIFEKSKYLFTEATNAILKKMLIDASDLIFFLGKHSIPIEIYRSLKMIQSKITYNYITTHTSCVSNALHDIDNDVYSRIIRVADVDPASISDINDDLQNSILDWIDENEEKDIDLKEAISHLCFYFMPLEHSEYVNMDMEF